MQQLYLATTVNETEFYYFQTEQKVNYEHSIFRNIFIYC